MKSKRYISYNSRRKALRRRKTYIYTASLAALAVVIAGFVFFNVGSDNVLNKLSAAAARSGQLSKPLSDTKSSISQAAASQLPSSLLNLTNWKLTLPISVSKGGAPEEITQPQLSNFSVLPYFQLNSQGNGVQFEAPVGGVTTSNSDFPRSELREMTNNGTAAASWSSNKGVNSMSIQEAITHLPSVRPQLVAGQIHGPKNYVILIRLNGSELFVEANGKNVGTLDNNYKLGTIFTVNVSASSGIIQVAYNGTTKAKYSNTGSGYYFKAGCYTQSNPTKGDSSNDYGQVIIYKLGVSHTT